MCMSNSYNVYKSEVEAARQSDGKFGSRESSHSAATLTVPTGVRPEPLSMNSNRDRGEPKVWLGSEGDYSAGRLVGDWYAAEDAEDVTVEGLHREAGTTPDLDSGEEIAVMDHEGFDVGDHVRLSPSLAVELAQDFETVESDYGGEGVEAYKAMIRDQGFGDHRPSPTEFIDQYAGDYASAEDYARELIDDTIPDNANAEELHHLATYVDTDRLERDLEIEDPGIDYDDIDEVMNAIDVDSVADGIIEENGGDSPNDIEALAHQQIETWVADGDHGSIEKHLDSETDYEDQAEQVVQSWVNEGDGKSIKDNLDYEFFARDLELGGDMNFLEKNDGMGSVHAFRTV